MIEVLNFVFQSFWTWLGCAILLAIATNGTMKLLGSILLVFRRG